jgi:hypothetical protein
MADPQALIDDILRDDMAVQVYESGLDIMMANQEPRPLSHEVKREMYTKARIWEQTHFLKYYHDYSAYLQAGHAKVGFLKAKLRQVQQTGAWQRESEHQGSRNKHGEQPQRAFAPHPPTTTPRSQSNALPLVSPTTINLNERHAVGCQEKARGQHSNTPMSEVDSSSSLNTASTSGDVTAAESTPSSGSSNTFAREAGNDSIDDNANYFDYLNLGLVPLPVYIGASVASDRSLLAGPSTTIPSQQATWHTDHKEHDTAIVQTAHAVATDHSTSVPSQRTDREGVVGKLNPSALNAITSSATDPSEAGELFVDAVSQQVETANHDSEDRRVANAAKAAQAAASFATVQAGLSMSVAQVKSEGDDGTRKRTAAELQAAVRSAVAAIDKKARNSYCDPLDKPMIL